MTLTGALTLPSTNRGLSSAVEAVDKSCSDSEKSDWPEVNCLRVVSRDTGVEYVLLCGDEPSEAYT